MTMSHQIRIALGLMLATGLTYLLDVPVPGRGLLVGVTLLAAPGLIPAMLISSRSDERIVLTVAISVLMLVLTSVSLTVAGLFSPGRVWFGLAVVTAAVAVSARLLPQREGATGL